MSAGIGEIAAITTALLWGVSNLIQGNIGRQIGSNSVVILRMPYQIGILGLLCLIMNADTSTTLYAFGLLAVSGIIGLALSDYCLYKSINIVGPAMAVLILSSTTVFTVILGRAFLGEILSLQAWAGIAITIVGILWVITGRSGSILLPGQDAPTGGQLIFGALLSFGAALSMSFSFILLKMALQTGVDPLWASLIRPICGGIVLWALAYTRGWFKPAWEGIRLHPAFIWLLFISCAAAAGGMWFSSVAFNLAPVGVAATLIGLQPIMVTMLGALWYKRQPSLRVVAGSLVAFGGTALICLR
ncbi:MAG: DMT family transporter [Deltaproteobacteria bacterium]|jgi:drug/metabolite transporter (DMT)-like permease|nr:DMT family transporter [Deltaproteobacteria bacterium]